MKRLALPLALAFTLQAQAAWAGNGTEIYDTRGQLITVVRGKERRIHLQLREIPQVTRTAVLAIEDSRFYEHNGVDLRGVARALWTDLKARSKVAGGSTITQQLVKNKYLNSEKTLSRKLDEARLAIEMEQQYSKDQILEMYLNEVYWGHGATGIEAAAQTYFGHSARTLSLPESAMLAALLKGPERYSPYRHPQRATERQHVVLDRMAELGAITKEEAQRAKRRKLNLPGAPGEMEKAAYFTSYLVNQLSSRFGEDQVLHGNLKIQTTLDLATQEVAEKLIKQLVATYGPRYRFNQAALVAMNPSTGAILAMVGGSSYRTSEYNRAVLAHRQPGSTFKPLVFLTAFNQGISATATMSDQVVTYQVNGHAYAPQNYRGEKEGTMTLRRALELSNNVITTKLLNQIGPEKVIETARRLGVVSPLQPTLSLGLGAYEVTPLELASVYGVLATNGLRTEPISYWNVRDAAGRLLDAQRPSLQRVYDEAPVRLVTDALRGVIIRGTGTAANPGRPAAGKTGTTSDSRDTWFVGYTPQLVVAIWAGNDDNSKMSRNAAGGTVVAPTWSKFVKATLKKVPVVNFAPPLPIARASDSANTTATASHLIPQTKATRSMEPSPMPLLDQMDD